MRKQALRSLQAVRMSLAPSTLLLVLLLVLLLHSLILTDAAPLVLINLHPQVTGVHVLRHNDLTAEAATHPTSVLYLSTPRNFAQATAACVELKEDLAVGESAFLKDILVGTEYFNHLRSSSDQVWIGNDCQTYNLRTHTIGRTDCQTKLPAVCTNKAPAPIQVTGSKAFGTVIGTRDSNSFRFLGIPYALPPVGALRFRPPEPAPPAASHDARQFGAVCPQETGTDYRLNRATESEDCLFLNVFTPSVKEVGEPSKLPVIVYFHGGGFKQYGGSSIFFEPGNLVSRGRVVVVTFNYRLGLLGLLENESIIPRSTLPGNLFLRDQILALQWVQDNIAAFGGDPSSVTLMGESAGAVSIRALLVIPQAFGLYRNVISQSDVIGAPFHEASTTSGIMGQTAMEILQCADLPCLQALPVEAIIKAQDQVIAHYYKVYVRRVLMLPFLPTVDHDLLSADFYALAQQGLVNPSPHIMWGSTYDENGIVMPPHPVAFSQYHATMVEYFLDDRVALLEHSPYYQPDWKDPDTVRATVVKSSADLYFYCPRFLLAELLPPQQQQQLYTFRFNRGRSLSNAPEDYCTVDGHVCHFADVIVSFGNAMGIPELGQSEDDAKFARQVVDRFVAFAKTGDPNPVVLGEHKGVESENTDVTNVQWEPFRAADRPVLELALASHMSYNAGAEACKWVEAQHVISFESDYKH